MSEHLLDSFKPFIIESLENLRMLLLGESGMDDSEISLEVVINSTTPNELSAYITGCFLTRYSQEMVLEVHEYLTKDNIMTLLNL